MEPFLGEIKMVGFNFAPKGWAFCYGQLMSIAQNSALFSLLGTMYGGDGRTTFGLPDLRGRVPVGQGNGPGLTPRQIGELSGEEHHTLLTNEMPAHAHTVSVTPGCSAEDAESGNPVGRYPATPAAGSTPVNAYAGAATGSMGAANGTANPAGGSQPHNNMQPYIGINFVIALEGIYPTRD